MAPPIPWISGLSKTYASGLRALEGVDLDIRRGTVTVDGHDIVTDYRAARALIGLVPKELTTDAFETVFNAVSLSRGLFGKAPNPQHIETVLRQLSLWTRKESKIMTLSGGMKRRLLIAKALSHEPALLFLGAGARHPGDRLAVRTAAHRCRC